MIAMRMAFEFKEWNNARGLRRLWVLHRSPVFRRVCSSVRTPKGDETSRLPSFSSRRMIPLSGRNSGKLSDVAAVDSFDESKFLGFEWIQMPRVLSADNTGTCLVFPVAFRPRAEDDRAEQVIKRCRHCRIIEPDFHRLNDTSGTSVGHLCSIGPARLDRRGEFPSEIDRSRPRGEAEAERAAALRDEMRSSSTSRPKGSFNNHLSVEAISTSLANGRFWK